MIAGWSQIKKLVLEKRKEKLRKKKRQREENVSPKKNHRDGCVEKTTHETHPVGSNWTRPTAHGCVRLTCRGHGHISATQ